jgi:hypothetical protein
MGKTLIFMGCCVICLLFVKQFIENGTYQYTNQVLKINHSSTIKFTKNVGGLGSGYSGDSWKEQKNTNF